MIGPLEPIIKTALADAGISAEVGTRVAPRHKFGQATNDWKIDDATLGAKGLVIRLDGGLATRDVQRHVPRYEFRCYGGTVLETLEVWQAVKAWTRAFNRQTVASTGGTALIYHVTPETEPSTLIDPDLDLPYQMIFVNAEIREVSTT